MHGKPLVYLDNAATTQKPRQVIDALVHYYENYNANIHRGLHTLAEEATDGLRGVARARSGASSSRPSGAESIVFTRNTTESINLVANAWGRKLPAARRRDRPQRRWSTTATSCPGSSSRRRRGAVLRFIDIDDEGRLRRDELRATSSARRRRSSRWRTPRTCWASTRCARSPALAHQLRRAHARRRRPERAAHARRRHATSTATSWPSPATRCSARPASACSGASRSCSRRWTRSSAAAR